MKGTVKWFNTQKGYGFIVGDDGTDYFVHYSNIKVSEFRHLDAGDHVEFDVETNDKGIQAINVVPVLRKRNVPTGRIVEIEMLDTGKIVEVHFLENHFYKNKIGEE